MEPSKTHLLHVSPSGVAVVLPEEMYAEIVAELSEEAKEFLRTLPPYQAIEVLKFLDAIKKGNKISVPWETYKYVSEVLKYSTQVDAEAIRAARLAKIREYISELTDQAKAKGCQVTVDEVMDFAMKNEGLWAGRHSRIVAEVFTYIFVRRKCDIELKINRRSAQLARTLEKVVRW